MAARGERELSCAPIDGTESTVDNEGTAVAITMAPGLAIAGEGAREATPTTQPTHSESRTIP